VTDKTRSPAKTNDHNGAAPRGRPRDPDADARILRAAAELLAEVGIEGTSMSAIVERSGVARATVYRRWPSRDAMLSAALSEVKGREPFPLSGDLEKDLGRAVEQARAVFAEPTFQTFLPALVRDLLRDKPASGVSSTFESVAPNFKRIADVYAQLAGPAGLRPEVNPTLVSDIVAGAVLAHLLSTGRVPSRALGDELLDVVLNGLRRRDEPSASSD
jgi:AcrR family transcriptional regulator